MSPARRQMIMFALGYFLAGAYLVSAIATALSNFPDTVRDVGAWVGWIAIAYVIVAFTFNVIDRRRNK